jgi:hypothetical protein
MERNNRGLAACCFDEFLHVGGAATFKGDDA